tara:strand:- start:104 stop:355 length:252 start_codon:yes stop_codon:yes gene_type:complete
MIAFTDKKQMDGIPIYDIVKFSQVISFYDAMERGISFIGNYYVIDFYRKKKKAFLITEDWVERDERLFTLDFIKRHKAFLGIV